MYAIDIETYDPDLNALGDGSVRYAHSIPNSGYVLCIGVYKPGYAKVFDHLSNDKDDQELIDILVSDEPKVFHNAIYDMSWINIGLGLTINRVYDTMARMSLVNEHLPHRDLDSCCEYFKIPGKNKHDTIDKWALDHGIKGPAIKQLAEIYSTPAGRAVVQKYLLQDCKATYELWQAQEVYIQANDLQHADDIESRILPIAIEMKRNGTRIDRATREYAKYVVESALAEVEQQLLHTYGISSDVIRSNKKTTEAMTRLGITSPNKSPLTGKPSWDTRAMNLIDHPVSRLMTKATTCKQTLSLVIEGIFTRPDIYPDSHIHSTFVPSARDFDGTHTGRFACVKPNLQQVSYMPDKFGNELRSVVIPEEGCMLGAFDLSQIEYRMLAHYATGPKAQWLLEQMNAGVDFHNLALEAAGFKSRRLVKNLNFGILYGMGIKRMRMDTGHWEFVRAAEEAGEPFDQYTDRIYNEYKQKVSFVTDTMHSIEMEVRRQGYVRSLSGRMHRPADMKKLYVLTNSKLQGSAADYLKQGLIDAWDAGVFGELRLHATVHDEYVVSIPQTRAGVEAAVALKEIMCSPYKHTLSVVVKADSETGPNWHDVSADHFENMKKEFL